MSHRREVVGRNSWVLCTRALLGATLLVAAGSHARDLPIGWTEFGVGTDTPVTEIVLTSEDGVCSVGCTWPEAVAAGLVRHPFTWIWDGSSQRYGTPRLDGLELRAHEAAWLYLIAPATLSIGADDGARLDLGRYTLDWAEEFDTVDVGGWGSNGGRRWFAYTPWGGDFGDAPFWPGAHRVDDGVLSITAERAAGAWRSGLLSLRHPDGRGRTWTTGYFEARMNLPEGPGTWPAFWLASDGAEPGVRGEIDVLELYGAFPDTYEAVWHTWGVEPHPSGKSVVDAPDITSGWHTVGVELTADELVFHLDRSEVWRVPRPDDWPADLGFYPLVNLALGAGWPIDETPDPSTLLVDHIRVYRSR